jgi:hypothetical protein
MIEQWTGFSMNFIRNSGFDSNFYPFSYKLNLFKIEKKWTGFRTLDYVGCNYARKHKDSISSPKEYYAFLIIRNDGFIAKGIRQPRLKLAIQKPGTLIILKRHCYHHVILDARLKFGGANLPETQGRFWIAIGSVFDIKPTRSEVFQLFQQFLYKINGLEGQSR